MRTLTFPFQPRRHFSDRVVLASATAAAATAAAVASAVVVMTTFFRNVPGLVRDVTLRRRRRTSQPASQPASHQSPQQRRRVFLHSTGVVSGGATM